MMKIIVCGGWFAKENTGKNTLNLVFEKGSFRISKKELNLVLFFLLLMYTFTLYGICCSTVFDIKIWLGDNASLWWYFIILV